MGGPSGGSGLSGYLTSCRVIDHTEMMKAVLALILIGPVAAGSYNSSKSHALENITIEGDMVIVDVGDYKAEFLAFLEFQKTEMILCGG